MAHTIAEVNQLSQAEFVELLGDVFEETPAVATRAWAARPFTDVSALHQAMVTVVEHMPSAEQLALIQAHPELGSRVQMADASVQEQAGAGLNQLIPAEYERFQTLNSAYKKKFGFPFIVAVKGHDKESILQMYERRLEDDKAEEIARSLAEISKIAQFRLADLIE